MILRHIPATRGTFQGVFPSDRLPSHIGHYPAAFVANVDPHDRPGSHWCAFYFDQNEHGEFFDSYGRKPGDVCSHFKQFLVNNSRFWTYNSQKLQSVTSNVCGHYCLYFLFNRCRHISLKTIVNRFSKNAIENDRLVYHFIMKHFGHLFYQMKKLVTHQLSVQYNKQRL